jgi:hypothetical protein
MVLAARPLNRWFAMVAVSCASCGDEATPSRELNDATLSVRAEPTGHTFDGTVRIELAADRPAAIYYTLDGSSPTSETARRYEHPLELSEGTLLTFVGVSADGVWSEPRVELYEQKREQTPTRIPRHALEVSTDAIFFSVESEHPPVETVRIRSTGLDRARIDRLELAVNPTGAAFYEEGIFRLRMRPALPISLAPGEMLEIELEYQPTATLRSAALVIVSNDERTSDGVHVVQLWGRVF